MNKNSFTNFLTVVVFAVTCGYGIGVRAQATKPAAPVAAASAPVTTPATPAAGTNSVGSPFFSPPNPYDQALVGTCEPKKSNSTDYAFCLQNVQRMSSMCEDLKKSLGTADSDFNSACGKSSLGAGDCANKIATCQSEADDSNSDFGTALSSLQGLNGGDSNSLFSTATNSLGAFGSSSKQNCAKLTATKAKDLLDDLDKAQKELTDAQKSVAADQLKSKQDQRSAQSDMMKAQGQFDKDQAQQFADLKKNQAEIQASLDKIDADNLNLNNQISAAQSAKGAILAKQFGDIETAGSALTDATTCRNSVLDYLNSVTGNGGKQGFTLGNLNGSQIKKTELSIMQNCLQARILKRDQINKIASQQLGDQDAIITAARLQISQNSARRSQMANSNAAVLQQQTNLNNKQAKMFLQSQVLDIQNFADISKNVLSQQQSADQDIMRIQQKISTYTAQITENGGPSAVQQIAGSSSDSTGQDVYSKWQNRSRAAHDFTETCCGTPTNPIYQKTCDRWDKIISSEDDSLNGSGR